MQGSRSISVSNFLGVVDVKVPLPDHPAAVTGPNASGKTSLATAIAGLLSRNPNPLGLGLTKRPYMHDSADYGEVTMHDADGTELCRWVLGEKSVRVFAECPDPVNPNVLAMVDFITPTRPSDRVKIWEPIFLPNPDSLIDQITERLNQVLPREKQVNEIVDTLRAKGWVDTEKLYREHGRDAKRDWARITGEPYGAKKAQTWHPTGWLAKLEGITILDASSDLEAARESLRVLQEHKAISASDVARAESAVEELPAAEEELKVAEAEFQSAAGLSRKASGDSADIKLRGRSLREKHDAHKAAKPAATDARPCPHEGCGLPIVVMEDGSLRAAEDESALKQRQDLWERGLERRAQELDSLRSTSIRLNHAAEEARKYQARAEGVRNAASDRVVTLRAEAKLAGEAASEEVADSARISVAEQAVDTAKEVLEIIENNKKAWDFHMSVAEYESIVAVLGPKGVRASELLKATDRLHKLLKEMTDQTGWPVVELDKSYAVHLNSRPAIVSSGSEKWRAQLLLQCAIAIDLGEKIVIADGADILRDIGNEKQMLSLISLCEYLSREHGINVLVCATAVQGRFPDHWPHTELVI